VITVYLISNDRRSLMGQRLAELAIQARTPLFMINGKPVYPIMGGAEDDQQESEQESKAGEESEEEEDHSEDDKSKDPRIKELSAENARRRHEAKRLADELEAAKAKLKEHEDADKSETEKLSAQVVELKERTAQLIKVNQELSIKNAFLADKKHAWRNPDSAMKLLDLGEVEITNDGTVNGLDKAIKKLAESDSYLLEQPDDEGSGKPPRQASGERPPGKPAGKAEKTREDLVKRFPALQR
jgi:predicted RNase H-like nuclease (RuvC/YqgF family)